VRPSELRPIVSIGTYFAPAGIVAACATGLPSWPSAGPPGFTEDGGEADADPDPAPPPVAGAGDEDPGTEADAEGEGAVPGFPVTVPPADDGWIVVLAHAARAVVSTSAAAAVIAAAVPARREPRAPRTAGVLSCGR
jgi:hypothetical protein